MAQAFCSLAMSVALVPGVGDTAAAAADAPDSASAAGAAARLAPAATSAPRSGSLARRDGSDGTAADGTALGFAAFRVDAAATLLSRLGAARDAADCGLGAGDATACWVLEATATRDGVDGAPATGRSAPTSRACGLGGADSSRRSDSATMRTVAPT